MRARIEKPASTLLVLSDSTGNLARHMMTAVLTQFPDRSIAVRFENFVRTDTQLERLLRDAKAHRTIVCHAMVSDRLKQMIKDVCKRSRLRCFDLTGGLADFIKKSTGVSPSGNLDALHCLDDAYHQRMDAMEFTLSHDDGLGLESLHEADVVLVGVSRTSKTPTSILLAQQGYCAANVSLAHGVKAPSQLLALPPGKVVGLIISADQLALIRARRQVAWGMAQTDYGRPETVKDEIHWCRSLFRQRGWPVLDVTDQAVEETAAKVIELVGSLSRPVAFASDGVPNN